MISTSNPHFISSSLLPNEANEFQRAERLHMDLIEARRLHADDESVKRLRADKDAADIKLKHAREELNAITAEYKRLVATKNAKDKVRVSGSVTAIRKRRVFVSQHARRVVCRANVLSTDGHSRL